MKALFFAGGSYVGGMEAATLTLIKSLVAAGHSAAAIVSGWNNGIYPRQLSEADIPFRCVKLGRLYRSKPLWTLDGLVNFPRAFKEIRAFVREFRPDVVVHTDIGLGFVALQVLPRDIQNVFHLYNVPNEAFNSFMGKMVMSRCSGCLAASNFVAGEFASRHPGVKVRTVYNAVEIPRTIRRTSDGLVRIGIIGQILPRKRHKVLIDAVAMLEERVRQKIEIRIYGPESNGSANIRDLIEERSLQKLVKWMGFVESRDDIYANVDIVVAPAVDEPFGTTVLEAGAYAVAVIAARSGGFPEMVVHDRTGLLVSPDNPGELARAIKRLVENRAFRTELGVNGQAHMASTFALERPAANFLSALEKFGVGCRQSVRT